jgi:hypothetical protein
MSRTTASILGSAALAGVILVLTFTPAGAQVDVTLLRGRTIDLVNIDADEIRELGDLGAGVPAQADIDDFKDRTIVKLTFTTTNANVNDAPTNLTECAQSVTWAAGALGANTILDAEAQISPGGVCTGRAQGNGQVVIKTAVP